MSTTGKGTGTHSTDPKNTSKATKGNDGGRVEDAITRSGSGGTPGKAEREGTTRANVYYSQFLRRLPKNDTLGRYQKICVDRLPCVDISYMLH